jgi:hypothetical protein
MIQSVTTWFFPSTTTLLSGCHASMLRPCLEATEDMHTTVIRKGKILCLNISLVNNKPKNIWRGLLSYKCLCMHEETNVNYTNLHSLLSDQLTMKWSFF